MTIGKNNFKFTAPKLSRYSCQDIFQIDLNMYEKNIKFWNILCKF